MLLHVALDGKPALEESLEFSSLGEASVRISGGGLVIDDVDTLSCRVCDEGNTTLAQADIGPPSGSDEDEWMSLPGARGHMRISLAVDVPGFTICFDAQAKSSSSTATMLHTIRLVRQRMVTCTASCNDDVAPVEDAACSGARDDDGVIDASDTPTFAQSTHGAWLRATPRPPVRCWHDGFFAKPEAGHLDVLRRDACALVAHGLGGRTFWIARDELPRCSLEQFALEVLRFHEAQNVVGASAATCDSETFLGAEWWIQMRSVGSGEADDDGASIAFHFDCDEGTFSATGELIPPWLSTITYLGEAGAPTLILPATPDAAGDVVATTVKNGASTGAFVSYPRQGKHLAFPGTLLHGCPAGLTSAACSDGGLRLTFLVNLWQRHRPRGPTRLQQGAAAALGHEHAGPQTDESTAALQAPMSFLSSDSLPPVAADLMDGTELDQCFAPSAARKRTSPAARSVVVRGLPCAARLRTAEAHLVHTPRAVVVPMSGPGL